MSWLIHRTGITKGAAVGHTAWAKRTATHPQVLAALAAGQVTEPVGRLICLWTGKLPEQYRDDADEVLLAAAAAGLGLEELAALFGQMYERARGDLPDQDPDRDFEDRALKLATTFGGAGSRARGPHAGVRGDGGPGAGRAVRPGRGRGRRGPRISGTTTRWPRRCGGWPLQACCPSGPGSRSKPGRISPWPT